LSGCRRILVLDILLPIPFNGGNELTRAKPMKKLILAVLLLASPVLASQVLVSPVWAQTKLTPKNATARVDNCAPIGRTANGELVYSMKCDNLPAPPAPPQAEANEPPAAPPAPEVQRSGLFGLSYEVRRPDQ
jgi:hypothetical protein